MRNLERDKIYHQENSSRRLRRILEPCWPNVISNEKLCGLADKGKKVEVDRTHSAQETVRRR